jgi:hypothetical protein
MGRNWQVKETGFGSLPVIAIGARSEGSQSEARGDMELVAGTLNETSNMIEIWAADSGGAWVRWHQEEVSWYTLQIGFLGDGSNPYAILGLGTKVYEASLDGHFTLALDLEGEPITALAVSSDGTSVAVASLGQVFMRASAGSWEPLEFDGPGEPAVGLQFSPKFESDRILFALTSTGKLWQAQIDD